MSDKSERHRTLMEAIARLERAISTRPFHTDYGLAKQDGLRDAVSELKMMDLDDAARRRAAAVTLCDARVIVGDSEGEERCGNPWPCATHGGRRCPECGSREINATEAVCLACSNRAWSDR